MKRTAVQRFTCGMSRNDTQRKHLPRRIQENISPANQAYLQPAHTQTCATVYCHLYKLLRLFTTSNQCWQAQGELIVVRLSIPMTYLGTKFCV
jgi:hypothetical protein